MISEKDNKLNAVKARMKSGYWDRRIAMRVGSDSTQLCAVNRMESERVYRNRLNREEMSSPYDYSLLKEKIKQLAESGEMAPNALSQLIEQCGAHIMPGESGQRFVHKLSEIYKEIMVGINKKCG